MFSKSFSALFSLTLLALSVPADARIRWAERDGHAVLLHPRRFGQEHPAVIDKLSAACEGQVCGVLAGQAITPLLAAQGECTQQDMADSIINAAQQFDDATKANMIALAVEYRQAEKNTSPDFTTNPPTNRNSVFCQKAPQNAELNGLVQAQDPANDAVHFFDPATGKTVLKGDQPNTFPFGTDGSSSSNSTSTDTGASASASASAAPAATSAAAVDVAADTCPTAVTVTVTAGAAATNVAATTTAAAAAATTTAASTSSSSDIGDFGSCTVPQIQFATGFDNRKETSFEPVDQTSYNHGSAQNIDIITQFICDTLTNTCGADATAKATCATAKTAADGQTAKTGAQADAFNAVFGITTNFAAVAVVDDTGSTISPGAASTPAATSATAAAAAATTTAAAQTSAAASTTAAAAAATSASSSSASTGTNLQTFTGSLGGVTPPAVTDTGSGSQPFSVEGNATFSSLQNALVRSCDVQHNQCANKANSSGNSGDLTVDACGTQQEQCNAQAQTTAASA